MYNGSSRDPLYDKIKKIKPTPNFGIYLRFSIFFLSPTFFFARIDMINRILHVNPYEQPNITYRICMQLVLHYFTNRIIYLKKTNFK